MFGAALGLGLHGQDAFQGRKRKRSETIGMLQGRKPVRLAIDAQQAEHTLRLFPGLPSRFQEALEELDGRGTKLLKLLSEQTTSLDLIAGRQVLA